MIKSLIKRLFTRKIILRIILVIVAVWALLLPYFTQKQSNESLADIAKPATQTNEATQAEQPKPEAISTLGTGTFKGINGKSAAGEAKLLKTNGMYFLRLEDNFTVSNGPDLFVTLGSDGNVGETIAPLKANSGGQNYELPSTFDPTKHSQVIIHCRAFNYSFAVADLVQ